jgi:hypothetical protein
MGLIALGVRQLLQISSIGFNRHHFKAAVDPAYERNQIAAWRPDGKIVVFAG